MANAATSALRLHQRLPQVLAKKKSLKGGGGKIASTPTQDFVLISSFLSFDYDSCAKLLPALCIKS